MDAMDLDFKSESPTHSTPCGDDVGPKQEDVIYTHNDASFITIAKPPVVRWHVFGNTPQYLSVDLQHKPKWWRKLLTRIFLGSVWIDL